MTADQGPTGGAAHPSDAACAGALAGLPGIGPAQLRALLADRRPAEAWAAVIDGRVVRAAPAGRRIALGPSWAALARRADPVADLDRWRASGIAVTWPGQPGYPGRLVEDPQAPGVLFVRGDPGRLAGRCVAVVGTRRATPEGRACAYHLGRDLAAAGVCVVSGLALGIDGAAHAGALQPEAPGPGEPGGTAGVAASGVDVAYPPAHAELWERVAATGVLLSETPPGQPARAWRFPSRNRVIAALAEVVVVVESHSAGGSLHTAEAALDRGIELMAVPGPVAAPSSAGTNQLLHDGAAPARDAADVLDALGMLGAAAPSSGRRRRMPGGAARLAPARPRRTGGGRGPGPGTVAAGGGPCPPAGLGPVPGRPPAGGVDGGRRPAAAGGGQLGLPVEPAPRSPDRSGEAGGSGPGGAVDARVLDAVGWGPTTLGRVVERAGLPLGATAAALDRLAAAGAVVEEGGWWQRLAPRSAVGPPRTQRR